MRHDVEHHIIGGLHRISTDRGKVMDALITNFHLPESTLLMLVSALAGKDNIMAAYEEAVKEEYRFFSFGAALRLQYPLPFP